ncbi:MAG: Flp pilus assembly protein TadD [Myxococcota bacterium]|jgi:Flp pilus assembly protein TadD
MDKTRKLRRYSRKDYTQLVDFPVEIVGRDGVVRRYSFEESVRLYQRRIASAASRYPDLDVAVAEMRHCKLRIDQLRRSYFARYGWTALESARDGVGAFAGEVAAFLRRCLESLETEPELYALTGVGEEEHRQIFYAHPRSSESPSPSYLLYFYAFQEEQEGVSRESFFDFLKALQGVRGSSGSVEGIVAFHHSADCGLILTGQGSSRLLPLRAAETTDHMLAEPPLADLVQQGLLRLQEGDHAGALRQFTAAYETNHYRWGAYIGAAALAEQLGRYEDVEMTAVMGEHYFPSDPVLRYFLAVARLRQGDGEGAAAALRDLQTEPAVSPYARQLIDGLIALTQNRMRRGRRLIRSAQPAAGQQDSVLIPTQRWVRAQLAARNLLMAFAASVALATLTAAWLWLPWLAILAIPSLLIIPAIHSAWRRQFRRLLSMNAPSGLRLVEPSVLQTISRPPRRSL